ncbi:hypothetical protein D9M69_502220 [compost metagenome]
MRARVRRDHGRAGAVGLLQRFVAVVLQVEIGQAVVDQVHRHAVRQGRVPERAVAPQQLARIGHHGDQALRGEQRAHHFEFGRQVLLAGRVVHDQHVAQRRVAALRLPFGAEHGDEHFVERHQRIRRVEQRLEAGAAGAVRPCQRGVEQGAAGVAVDLDQLGAVGGEVEVVAHEHAGRTPVQRCDRVRSRQGQGVPGGQGYHSLQRGHSLHDLLLHPRVQEHRAG